MKVTIIGAGNLGGAIACGLARGTVIDAENITCVDTNPEALKRLKATGCPFKLTTDIRKAIPKADILILAVKPHAVAEVAQQGHGLWDLNRQIFFTVVAGISFEDYDRYMFEGMESVPNVNPVHFRVMPNTAVSIGESMNFIASRNANAAQIKLAESIFGELGRTMVIPERLMPAAMAVGSCGIAYAMRYVRAAISGAIEAGFSFEEASSIVLQVMNGAIKLLSENGQHPEVEIDRVITPGGFTIRGLNAMEERGFSNAIIAGIREGYTSSK